MRVTVRRRRWTAAAVALALAVGAPAVADPSAAVEPAVADPSAAVEPPVRSAAVEPPVLSAAVEPSVPLAAVAFNDRGINPYHDDFSAALFPDPDILALTEHFTRHPSEYLPGYPADAEALELTLGEAYLPDADQAIFSDDHIEPGRLYWIPGTKIVGVVAEAPETRVPPRPVLDEVPGPAQSGALGHGTGVASVGAGNLYGSCPACLIVAVQGSGPIETAGLPFVDVSSNSYVTQSMVTEDGAIAEATRMAAQAGQVTLFGAGNGLFFNFWPVPYPDGHLAEGQGPQWVLRVGGVDRNNGRPLIGDGVNHEVSSYAIGDIPAATSNGTSTTRQFGGTSAATPITAGVMAQTLRDARGLVGDPRTGPRGDGVLAVGAPVPDSPLLDDGVLSRAELLALVVRTAFPRVTTNDDWEPATQTTAPYHPATSHVFHGYGTVDADTLEHTAAVLRGLEALPQRQVEDAYFRDDHDLREEIWGPCGCDSWLDV